MTKEEAARILDPETTREALAEIEYYGGFRGEEAVLEAAREARRIAAEALRHKPTGDPLTPEQLRKMDGQPVWVEFEDRSGGLWGIVHISVFEQIVFPDGLHCTIGQPYYGKIYKAYAYPPAHIDMEAWKPCECCRGPIGDEPYAREKYPGICDFEVILDGSEEITINAYNHCTPITEEICFSFPVAFCPKCGRPLTEEARAELEKRLRG